MERRTFLAAAGALGAGVVGYGVLVEPRRLAFSEHTVRLSSKGAEVGGPPDAQGRPLVIVQISDLHLKKVDGLHAALASEVDATRPDLLLFTGDTVDRRSNLPLAGEFLSLLRTNAPKVAVMGNWEYWGGVSASDLQGTFQRAGGEVLVNRTLRLELAGRELLLTGVDDWAAGAPDLSRALAGAVGAPREAGHHIFLSHCPILRDLATPRLPWMLSGHTHGGQINVLGMRFVPRGSGPYLKGWYRDRLPHLYVSKGIGTSVVPVRIGARPEVAVFHVVLA